PACGQAVASSAYTSAPTMETSPPSRQAPNIHAGLPANDATIAGALKIPAPTTMPTMMATACHRVSTGRGWLTGLPPWVTESVCAFIRELPWSASAPEGFDEIGMHDGIEPPGATALGAKAPASRLGDGKRQVARAEQAARQCADEGLVADQHDGVARLRERRPQYLAVGLEAGCGLEPGLDDGVGRERRRRLPGPGRRAAQHAQRGREARREPAAHAGGLGTALRAQRPGIVGLPARQRIAGVGVAPEDDITAHGCVTPASRVSRRNFCISVSRDSGWAGSFGMQSTGQSTRHCGSSK